MRSFALLGDERLARLAGAGHERAFTVVYQRYHQSLYRYCRSILRDDADAQDALQSTFAAAFAALARGQRDAPIRPWLFRIAHNEAISVVRRRRPTADLSAASDASTASAEDRVAERAELRLLLHDLDRLTERQRSALVMRELSGLSHEDIAIALGTSVGTAKQTIYEARRSMGEFAEGRAMPCDEIRRTISDADGRALRGRRVRAHLLECSACADFAAAIPARSADLRALAPVMPMAAAVGLLEHVVGAGSGHAAGGGLTGLATVAAGKTAALTANALAGVAVVAGATVGVSVGVGSLVHDSGQWHPLGRAAPAVRLVTPVAPVVAQRSSSSPAVNPRPQAVRTRHAAHGGPVTRRSIRAAVSPAPRSAAAVLPAPGRVTSRAGGSTSITAPALTTQSDTGLGKANGPAGGNSVNAPGHNKSAAGSATRPDNSASAPGHNKSITPTSATGPGNSASARGRDKSSATGPGNSASATGHNKSVAESVPVPTTAVASTTVAGTPVPTTPVATTPAMTVVLGATTPAPVDPPPKKHSK
jgi:RNA polymerase sigma factor (sigma-70 family)